MEWHNDKYFGVIEDGVLRLSRESQALLARENLERIAKQEANNEI